MAVACFRLLENAMNNELNEQKKNYNRTYIKAYRYWHEL